MLPVLHYSPAQFESLGGLGCKSDRLARLFTYGFPIAGCNRFLEAVHETIVGLFIELRTDLPGLK